MKSLAGLGFLLATSLAIFILDNHLFIFKNVSRVGEKFLPLFGSSEVSTLCETFQGIPVATAVHK